MKNSYEIRGEVTAIFLQKRSGKTIETLIDTSDLEKAMTFPNRWSANLMRNTKTYYVVGDLRLEGDIRKKWLLHRVLTDAPDGLVVDHINHNTLDNRKSNLRVLTNAQNFQNMNGPYKNTKSGIRGVCWHKAARKWYASIKINGKCKYLGVYDDIEEAEAVAKEARKKLMPFYVED
ncbi:HNH endonuclease [Paenibacillus kribbensis]|uniref:HNH endonuclease n=1 Tax=Paenibacillus kribbensis TaxID=172713 RepID=UPI002DBEFC56|nr:HNH endonuclease [Paenibacillus kribbensis]MEC0237798.1 HNH endonuclease [Paenibacillus kribbensis]